MTVRRRLQKEEILRGRDSFRILFKHGRFKRGKHLAVLYLPANETKVAFAVSSRVKGAVRRNRIRRRLREVYRLNKNIVQNPAWLLLLGQSKTYRAAFQDLEEEFRRLVADLECQNE